MRAYQMLLLGALLFLFQDVSAQNRTITGKITDDKGNPLTGVSVIIKNSKSGVLTDSAGVFRLTVQPADKWLIASGVGFVSKEIKIGNASTIKASLSPVRGTLEEVVVVGYGIQNRRDLSGSVNANSLPSGAPQWQQLHGRAPGLAVKGRRYKKANASYHQQTADFNTEEYDHIAENSFYKVIDDPLSTFSIDVDAASYSNVRRFLNDDELPPADAVRIEEMVNYFRYDYAQPSGKEPFSIYTEFTDCPWNKKHQLVMVGLQGKNIPMEDLPPSNIVFLIDVSGSMATANKLPLVQSSMKLLVDQLREQDRISIVVYAGAAGLVLPATSGAQKKDH